MGGQFRKNLNSSGEFSFYGLVNQSTWISFLITWKPYISMHILDTVPHNISYGGHKNMFNNQSVLYLMLIIFFHADHFLFSLNFMFLKYILLLWREIECSSPSVWVFAYTFIFVSHDSLCMCFQWFVKGFLSLYTLFYRIFSWDTKEEEKDLWRKQLA